MWLQKIATGSLKWRPDEFEIALIPDILLAYQGHIDELKMIYGSSKEKNKIKITDADDFAKYFGG